jgi:hypothetical protein
MREYSSITRSRRGMKTQYRSTIRTTSGALDGLSELIIYVRLIFVITA